MSGTLEAIAGGASQFGMYPPGFGPEQYLQGYPLGPAQTKSRLNPLRTAEKLSEGGFGAWFGLESYLPLHELGHIISAYASNLIPGINSSFNIRKSNLGDNFLAELLESFNIFPNIDSSVDMSYKDIASIIDNDGPLAYAVVGSDNALADLAILAGGHLGVLGIGALMGYFANKTKNLGAKIYSTVLEALPALQVIRDYMRNHNTSDIYRIAQGTGLSTEIVAGAFVGLSALLLAYNWIPTLKQWHANRKLMKEMKAEDRREAKYAWDPYTGGTKGWTAENTAGVNKHSLFSSPTVAG
ncbi:hypothetical protein KY347_01215 [Candidatus Woesearchaeota archaeon]|nr:hypothetical protein [Candidatus Woesearchaeota archaeon]